MPKIAVLFFHYLAFVKFSHNTGPIFLLLGSARFATEKCDILVLPLNKRFLLQIRDGGHGFSPLVGQFCGTEFPPMITSKDSSLWLRFHSDENIEYSGFVAVYEYIPRPTSCEYFIPQSHSLIPVALLLCICLLCPSGLCRWRKVAPTNLQKFLIHSTLRGHELPVRSWGRRGMGQPDGHSPRENAGECEARAAPRLHVGD